MIQLFSNNIKAKYPPYWAAILLFLFSFIYSHQVVAQQSADKQLDNLKHEITKQKSTIKDVSAKRQKLQNQLRKDELAIAKVIKALTNINQQLKTTNNRLAELKTEKKTLNQNKKKQENILAKQLRAAYSAGHHDYIKLLLNQQEPSSVQRTLSYYQYLNTARIEQIEEYKTIIARLVEIEQEQNSQQIDLAQLNKQQTKEKQSLEANKSQREKTVKSLNKQLLSSQQQLAKLEAEEENLVATLKRMAELSSQEVELNGLAKLKRKLTWPVKGKISRSFGSRKQGYLKWKGVLLSAPVGRTVNTVHNGVILFSDWLKGYGLVTVVDHGNGYMSLYGHNQALLKSVGDRVETGEPIALVGQSGGQSQPALYFEIRHNGQAVNPKLWCR